MRKVCTAGEVTEFAFDKSAMEYRVKNFTDNDILVTHKDEFVESEASKIKSMHGYSCGCLDRHDNALGFSLFERCE